MGVGFKKSIPVYNRPREYRKPSLISTYRNLHQSISTNQAILLRGNLNTFHVQNMTNVVNNSSSTEPKRSFPINFVNLTKQDLGRRDIFGRTILHLLILTNRYDLLKRLFKHPEFKSILASTDYENGWNCLHYVIFHKRLSCFKAIMEYLKPVTLASTSASMTATAANLNNTVLLELLRCKDRNRLTPLQLLDNDFKDLLWIPEYINEMNELQLIYRFKGTESTKQESQETNQQQTVRKRTNISYSSIRSASDWWVPSRGGTDILVFGSNKNNTLGLGDSKDIPVPSKLPTDPFHSKLQSRYSSAIDGDDDGNGANIQDLLYKPRFIKLILSKYHSTIITQAGELYSCGIGSRGRLGHGIDDMSNKYKFKRVRFRDALTDDSVGSHEEDNEDSSSMTKDQKVIDMDTSNNHTIALTSRNELYGWGLNTFNQLGFTTSNSTVNQTSSKKGFVEIFEPSPRKISTGELRKNENRYKGIVVSKIHSLVYTKNEIYSWGLCIGQMGVSPDSNSFPGEIKVSSTTHKGFIQPTPKRLVMRDTIKLVSACETCTCVVTSENDIHVYFQYQHIKLPKILQSSHQKNNQFHVFKPAILTKSISIKKVQIKSPELVVFLLENGNIVKVDDIRNPKYTTIWKAHNFDMIAIDFDIAFDGSIVLCTRSGSVFVKGATSSPSSDSTLLGASVRRTSMSEASLSISAGNKFKKLDNLNKVSKVFCDDQYLSFGFIRDEIDLLPLKLHKNPFFNDMMHLESIKEGDLYRKQGELFIPDGPGNSYVNDFIFATTNRKRSSAHDMDEMMQNLRIGGNLRTHEEEEDDEEDENNETNEQANKEASEASTVVDLFQLDHTDRFSTKRKPVKARKTFQNISKYDKQKLIEDLKNLSDYVLLQRISDQADCKGFNCFINLEKQFPNSDIKIGFHDYIFMTRSSVFNKILKSENHSTNFKLEDDVQGTFDPNKKELCFDANINLKALLIFIHFLYTNDVLSIWDDYPLGIHCPRDIREIKQDFDKLVRVFNLTDVLGKLTTNEVYLRNMRKLLSNATSMPTDVLFQLQDGSISCHSSILISRSAYFETLLSNRWDTETERVIAFDSISKLQFEVILKHLYGYNNNTIFDSFKPYLFGNENEKGVVDEFINLLLDLIEISDELLLFELKSLCELGIKDFINVDNVLILLQHADFLSARKLFMNCCWFIYNNLELLLLDLSFKELPLEILKRLEKQILFISKCKYQDFVDNGTVSDRMLENWFELNSSKLVSCFLHNMEEYNENFVEKIGKRRFEPLFDLKKEKDRKKYRAMSMDKSRSSSVTDLTSSNEVGKTVSSGNADLYPGLVAFRNGANGMHFSNNSAIDDDEEFEQVSYRRRKSSASGSISVPTSAPNPSNVNTPMLGSMVARKSFSSNTERKPSLPGLSPHSNWASPAIKDQPILGVETEKKTKVKVLSAPRLSQKERKKKALLVNEKISSNGSGPFSPSTPAPAPWTAMSPSPSPSSSLPSSYNNSTGWAVGNVSNSNSTNISKLPVLGGGSNKSHQKQKIANNSLPRSTASSPSPPPNNSSSSSISSVQITSGIPSLTEIMIQESLKIEEQQLREKERKSLQEIQQEQEFDRWWSEETAKFQRLNASNGNANGNGNRTPNNNPKKSSKKRTVSRTSH